MTKPYQLAATDFGQEQPPKLDGFRARGHHACREGWEVSHIYHLKLSVLEEALLGFVNSFDPGASAPKPNKDTTR
jgi:hypothetical protein